MIEENKEQRKFKDTIFGICLIALLILIVGSLCTIPIGIVGFFIKSKEISFILEYLSTIGTFIGVIVYLKISKENDILKKLSINNNKFSLGTLIGLLIGFFLNVLCVYMAYKNGNLSLSYIGASIPLLIFAFVSVWIQSTSEELLCRLFIYEKLKKYYKSPLIWIIVNSAFFGILHIFNPGVTLLSIINIIIFGLLMSCLIYFFDNIWVVSAIHTAWNFSQNIIFGLPNSGIKSEFSIYKLISSSDSFYYNVNFGVEGTLFTIIILCITTIIICLLGIYKKNRKVKN